jgi:hypothetical protein
MISSPGMKRPLAHAKVLARIGGLAGLYQIDLDDMYQSLSVLGDELSRRVLVTVPHTFDRIAITTRASRERAAEVVAATQLARFNQLAPGATELEIELETGGESVTRTLRGGHNRPVDALAPTLQALGVPSLGIDRVTQAGERLGGVVHDLADRFDSDSSSRWTLHYRYRNDDDAVRADTERRIMAVAEALAVTKPQKSIIEGLHGVLAAGADSQALLSIGVDESVPVLSLRWIHVPFETVIRMMLGFYPKLDAGRRLGELAGALAASRTTAMELQFGVTEPPAMRIAVAL